MPALYPMMSAATDFRPGDVVRKFVTEWNMTPYVGTVSHIVPATQKVWVQWPTENASESPETLIRVNPMVAGLPTAMTDMGYSSYEKTRSEKLFGRAPLRPRRVTASEKMAIRVAYDFSVNVIGKLVDDICDLKSAGLSDVQTYNRVWDKYGHICPDHQIKMSIERVYVKE